MSVRAVWGQCFDTLALSMRCPLKSAAPSHGARLCLQQVGTVGLKSRA